MSWIALRAEARSPDENKSKIRNPKSKIVVWRPGLCTLEGDAKPRERSLTMADKFGSKRTIDAPPDANPDAITGAPGSHPVGTGVGAAAAGAAGAAIGSVVPGAGTVVGGAVGAVVGAIAGGLAGKGVAEAINPTAEEEYWRDNYSTRPYVAPGAPYDDYASAYRYGYTTAPQHPGKDYEEVEEHLERNWERNREGAKMEWARAKHATKDAWQRVKNRAENRKENRNP
jgi:hypothetical protein